jgi:antagonist of KipI
VSVVVLKKGLLDTIQDNGRYGYQHIGINPGGSMDKVSASIANMLVLNNTNEPIIELHFPAAVFQFTEPCVIAITGANFGPEIDGKLIPMNTSLLVARNSTLQFKRALEGARSYLAINGKWDIKKWLSSYSTNTKASAGGYKGRALIKNDVIKIRPQHFNIHEENKADVLPVVAEYTHLLTEGNAIRLIKNNEYLCLTEESKKDLESTAFKISLNSDRMGYRLKGKLLKSIVNDELLSSAVTMGTIQLLPSGEMIILMADHQTTGGYPKIANVISADLPKLAQMKPNDSLVFKLVELDEAEDAYNKEQQQLNILEEKIKQKLTKIINDSY